MTKTRKSRENPSVRDFIIKNIEKHQGSITSLAAKQFGLSRAAINRYMHRLIAEGILAAHGKTNARVYILKPLVSERFMLERTPYLTEDGIWREKILPHMKGIKKNIIDICQYGFTEMVNNVIDHSQSPDITIAYTQNFNEIEMRVRDSGIGIFEKIQKDFHLDDPRSALLELSKGKLTSDSKNHTGEGIFFTSRMFDTFTILSGHLFYERKKQKDDDWLIEASDENKYHQGTYIKMQIQTAADWTMREVLEQYEGDSYRFRKTHVPVKLGKYPGEQLVSRSQAKRILQRFDKFSEVILDFEGVPEIGQGFADEIFRVFANNNPKTQVFAINTSPDVKKMISHVRDSLQALSED